MEEKCRRFSLQKMPRRILQIVVVAAFLLANSVPLFAQSGVKVTGVVKSDTDGFPLIGVNVVQKGTTNGTVTDFDGNFTITVPVGADLDFTYIGFNPLTVKVTAGRTTYDVNMVEDTQALDEVVVVGYGVQKKKLVTGATVQVGAEDLMKMSTPNVMTALQSQTPGVSITASSGMPGEDYKVNIRGIGTIGKSGPLYVIDGVSGGNINNLNPSDIESIDVLKDAASAAIYGSRGANGVILVTTKQGKSGKMQLSYDGSFGVQNAYKIPSMVTAKQYMALQDERVFNDGGVAYDWSKEIPTYLYEQIMNGEWEGTNWMKEFLNEDAIIQNHAINLIGGTDVSKISLGVSASYHEGIIGAPIAPQDDRYTVRLNTEHVLLKVKDFNAITIGENLLFTHRTKSGMQGTGNQYWNDINNMLVAIPLMPLYNQEGQYYDQPSKSAEGWVLQGSAGNPIYDYVTSSRANNSNRDFTLRSSAYIDIQPIKNLHLRSQFAYNRSSGSYRSYSGIRHVSTTSQSTTDNVSQNAWAGYDIAWTNTATYSTLINQEHAIDAMIGQEILKSGMGENVSSGGNRSMFGDSWKNAYVDNTKPQGINEVSYGGRPWDMGRTASFFGRVGYNYKETYMATFSLRADGSSNFARGNRWGYFPAASAGWVMTNENFMESLRDSWLDFFKIRGSWGQNGNNNIDNFQYLATIASNASNAYYFGESKEIATTGAYADILPNKDISWETQEMTNIGFDARLLNSRLGVTFDWYRRTTKDWLVRAPQLATYGTGAPYINGGDIRNQGVELMLTWNDRIGDFTYGANFNISTNENEVTRIANAEGIIHGNSSALFNGSTEMYRVEVGQPVSYFWGYKTEGVFQNQAQIDAYRAANKAVLDTAQPGDLIFVDTAGGENGGPDGKITDEDKVNIGNPTPKFEANLSLNLGYKGFDFSITAHGKFDYQLARSYRSWADGPLDNFTTDVFGRWHGEGTSNKLPRLTAGSHTNWQWISDIYIEDVSFVRIQNVTLGYDFKKLFPQMPLGRARLYVAANNLFTFTGYTGVDPEIGSNGGGNDWARGMDVGYYPQARTYVVGVNLTF